MADFRRSIIVLAALALLLGTVGTASAANAPFSCVATGASSTQLRAEGLTEKVGDMVIACTGGTPVDPGVLIGGSGGTPYNVIPTANIQIFLNTTVTSRLLNVTTGASESELLIDEPTEVQQKVCPVTNPQTDCRDYGIGWSAAASPFIPPTPLGGAVNSGTLSSPTYNAPGAVAPYNVYQGQQVSPGSVTFNGVPVDAPGTSGTRIFRITNIRANANALGVTSASAPPIGVTETISVSGTTPLPITNNAQQVVGFVQKGLIVSTTTATSYQQCVTVPFDGVTDLATTVTLSKGFAASFKIRNIATTPAAPNTVTAQDLPGATYNSEYFFYNPTVTGLVGAGIADYGTRLRVVFGGVQAGVTIWMPTTIEYIPGAPPTYSYNLAPISHTNLYAVMVTSEGGAYTAATPNSTSPTGYASITVSATGAGEAVYEVLQANTGSLLENLAIPVFVSYTANPGANSPALGTATVGASFAPVSTDTNASATDTIPRFADTSVAANSHSINKCATHLLFPFVTNQAGFETGFAISNTSQDQYGTSTQTGTCTFNFYGASAPAAVTTPSAIVAGTTYTNLASTLAPGFQGYVIVDCQFQYAHGFAFITQIGTFLGTEGYLALIIPDPPRSPIAFPNVPGNSGEQLGF